MTVQVVTKSYVSVLSVHHIKNNKTPKAFFIQNVHTIEDYRSQGFAAQTLQFLWPYLVQAGYVNATLKSLLGCIRLYDKLGFIAVDTTGHVGCHA